MKPFLHPPSGRVARNERGGRIARSRLRPAFTLVELLVVVAIIGVLVALLLPAVQAAREAARRTSCANNLIQLVMALHQYESTHQVYPPGTVNATGPIKNQLQGYHHGWIEQLLPYLEAEAVYHHIDRDVSVYHRRNTPVRRIRFSWLNCPSSPQGGDGFSNYAAVHHDVESAIDTGQNGVFFLNSAVTRDDVSDGAGYTLFLGEKLFEPFDLGWASGTRSILRNTGERINTATMSLKKAGIWRTVGQYPPGVSDPQSGGMFGGGMLGGGMTDGEISGVKAGDAAVADNSSVVVSGPGPREAATFVGGFAGYHPGAANFAMGDGSIRLVTETIATPVYRRLGHRADGELLDLE